MVRPTANRVLIGRDAQIAELRAAYRRVAAEGRSEVVLVGGEAGIGKTTLAESFTAMVAEQGAWVITGQSVELGSQGVPYVPVVGAIRDLLGQAGQEQVRSWIGNGVDTLAELVPELGGVAHPGPYGRTRLFEVATTLFERASHRQPLVLVLEDLHWADASSRDLIQFVVRVLDSAPVLTIVTYRTDELHRGHPLRAFVAEVGRLPVASRLEVPRWQAGEVSDHLLELLGQAPAADVVERVHRRSDGVPFLVEELARAERDCGCSDLPESVLDTVLAQIEALSTDAQAVLRTLAVGAGEVSHQLLAQVSELDEGRLDTALREAVAAQVLRTTADGFRFRHALLHEAMGEELLPGERVRLHARYAQAIEQEQPGAMPEGHSASMLAYHWAAAHEVNEAFRWSIVAAEHARSSYADREAQRQYERALDLWDRADSTLRTGDRAELIERAAAAAQDADDIERAIALVDLALDDLGPGGPPQRRGDLLGRRARLMMWEGELPDAPDVVTTALELLEPGTPARMAALDTRAALQMIAGQHIEALRECAFGIAEATEYGDDVAVGALTITQATSEVALGRIDAGLDDYERARSLVEGDLPLLRRYHVNLSDTYHLIGRHREAVETALAGMELGGRWHLQRSETAMLAGNAAEPLLALGEWDRARDLVDRALATLTRSSARQHLQSIRAWYDLWTSNVAAAARAAERLRAGSRGRALEPQFQFPLRRLEAEIAMAEGDPARAWQVVQAGLELPETCAAGQALPLVAVGAAAIGAGGAVQSSSAREQLVARLRLAESRASTPVWPELIRAELAVDDAAAWALVVRALAGAEGPVHLEPYVQYRRARALLRQGDRQEAGAALRDAAARAEEIGATLISGWARDLGARAGIARLQPVRTEPAPFAGLTPREREVLRLVADGYSNGQIAAHLVISTKTASVHVSNILAKLGVSTRGEAAAAAHQARELAG